MRRGVTMLEVLVAAILLTIGLLGVIEVIGSSAGVSQAVDDRALALMAARSKMDEILKEPVLQTGSDQGVGVDTSTDYDWEAVIEPSANPSLMLVTVLARNRKTNVEVRISTLRRPDLETPPEGVAGANSSEANAAGGSAL
jgi:type IV pilus modification protein PilV